MRSSRGRVRLATFLLVTLLLLTGIDAADAPRPGDDATYRPTVMIRQEHSVGTGTIVASVEGETLILTAWHVVSDPGPLYIEVFRYNLGMERVRNLSGYPRKLEASVIARDEDTDLAILRVRGQLAFPYVARIARSDGAPAIGSRVTTIGFDKGARLIGFATRVRAIDLIDLDKGGGFRPFVVTDDPPELGRSGGGLFRADGTLVGVCLARTENPDERNRGLFATFGSVQSLIRSDEGLAASMARTNPRPVKPGR